MRVAFCFFSSGRVDRLQELRDFYFPALSFYFRRTGFFSSQAISDRVMPQS